MTITRSFDIINPGGHPGVLEHCAREWRSMARNLQTVHDNLDGQVRGISPAWKGDAADAFFKRWKKVDAAVQDAVPHFETVATNLETAAKAIRQINHQIHEILIEMAASTAVGWGLSVITAGFSDLAAAANDIRLAERVGMLIARLGRLLATVARLFEKLKEFFSSQKFLRIIAELAKNFAGNFMGNTIGQVLGGNVNLVQSTKDSALQASAGFGVSKLAGLGSKYVASDALNNFLNGKNFLGVAAVGATGNMAGQAGTNFVSHKPLLDSIFTSGVAGGFGGGTSASYQHARGEAAGSDRKLYGTDGGKYGMPHGGHFAEVGINGITQGFASSIPTGIEHILNPPSTDKKKPND